MRQSDPVEIARNDAFPWALINAAPDGIIVVEDGGRVVLANRRAEDLFGYGRGELLSMSVEELVPESFRDLHLAHRSGFGAGPVSRAMGDGRRLQGRRRDGSVITVEICLSPVYENRARIVMATIRPLRVTFGRDRELVVGDDERIVRLGDRVIRSLHAVGLSLQAAQGTRSFAHIVHEIDGIIREINSTIFEGSSGVAEHTEATAAKVEVDDAARPAVELAGPSAAL